MPSVIQPRLHHLAVTVTDLDASVAWYASIFDVHPVLDVPHPGGVGKILAGLTGSS
jgi:catechol 2,3-dioxygenase-like lactoylglutathione lyase family enzyme